MFTILSDPNNSGGIKRWVENMYFLQGKIYNVIKHFNWEKELMHNTIIINNYFPKNFKNLLETNKNKKIYFVVHSEVCPINIYLEDNIEYFFGTICISKSICDKVYKLYPKLDILYVPHNISLFEFKPIFKTTVLTINYVGRLSPEKNLPMLFYALADIKELEIEFNIFGTSLNPKYTKYLKKVAKHAFNDNINITVFFNGEQTDLNVLYACDLVVLASVFEGVPFCMLEALYYKIPVVAPNINSIKEYICDKSNGYLFNFTGLNNIDKLSIKTYNNLLDNIGYINNNPPKYINSFDFNKIILFEKNVTILKNCILFAICKQKKI